MISLKDRVCITALCARISGVNGEEHPRCIGEICVSWEQCNAQIVDAIKHYNDLMVMPFPRRRKKKWGEQG